MTTHHNNTHHNNTAHHDSTDRSDGHTASPAMPALVRTTVHVAQLATPPPAGFTATSITATSITATSITTTGGTTTGGTVGSDPVDQVIAALQGLEHAYATVITQLDPDPASGFDPARGSTPIIFALLDLTDLHPGHPTDHTPAPHPPAPQPPAGDGEQPAQQWLRDLLNQAADTVLTASQDPATPPHLTPLLADIMAALSTAHTLTFNTSW